MQITKEMGAYFEGDDQQGYLSAIMCTLVFIIFLHLGHPHQNCSACLPRKPMVVIHIVIEEIKETGSAIKLEFSNELG